jgi:hypothetical protein
MMAFESDSDAWFREQLGPRYAGIGTLTLAAIAILNTAKSIYRWGSIVSRKACL